ncbi:hypothetical protein, partial [Streptomyces neyagawaensis]
MLQSPPPAPPQASPSATAIATSHIADSRRSDLPVALRAGSPRTAAPGRPARRVLLGVAASLAAYAAGASRLPRCRPSTNPDRTTSARTGGTD